jgi:hypothetical protein
MSKSKHTKAPWISVGLTVEQPKQESVAWYDKHGMITHDPFEGVTPLYTEPPKREWVGLTDEEIAKGNKESWVTEQAWQSAVWWAEERLKEKNT